MRFPGQLPRAPLSGAWSPRDDLGLDASVSSPPAILLIVLMSIGIPGNMTVFCIYAARMRQTVTGVFFTCLSAFNALTVLVIMPLDLYELLYRFHHNSSSLCQAFTCLFFYTVVGPLVILVVIVIERTVKTWSPRLHNNGLQCMGRILVFLTIFSFAFAGPLIPLVSLQNSGQGRILMECGLKEDVNMIGILLFFFIALLLSTVILIVCFTLVLCRIPYFVKPTYKRQSELALESLRYWDMDSCYRYRATGPYSDVSSDIDLPIAPYFLLFQHELLPSSPFRHRPPSDRFEPDPEMQALMMRLTRIPTGTAVGGTGFLFPKKKPTGKANGEKLTFRELIMSTDLVNTPYWVQLMQLVAAGAISLDEATCIYDADADAEEDEDEADDILTELDFHPHRHRHHRHHRHFRRGLRHGGVTFDTRDYYSPSPPSTDLHAWSSGRKGGHSDATSNAFTSRSFDNKTDNNPAAVEETSRTRLEDLLISRSLIGTSVEHSEIRVSKRPAGDTDGKENPPKTDGRDGGCDTKTKCESTAIYVKGYGWWGTSGSYGAEGMVPWCGDPSPSSSLVLMHDRSLPSGIGHRRVEDSTSASRAGLCVGYPLEGSLLSDVRLGETKRTGPRRTPTEGALLRCRGSPARSRRRVRTDGPGRSRDEEARDDDIETPGCLSRRQKATLTGGPMLRSGLFKWSSWIDDFRPRYGEDTDIDKDDDNDDEGFQRDRLMLSHPERDEVLEKAEEKEQKAHPFPPSPIDLRWTSEKDHQSEKRSSPFEQKQSPKSKGKDKCDVLNKLSESEHSQCRGTPTSEEDRETGKDSGTDEAVTAAVITQQPQRQTSALEDIVEVDDEIPEKEEDAEKRSEKEPLRRRDISAARSWHSRGGGALLQQRRGSRHSFTDMRDASAESHSFDAQISTHYLPTETAVPLMDRPSPRIGWGVQAQTPSERVLRDHQRPSPRIGWGEDLPASTERTSRELEHPSPRLGWGPGDHTLRQETAIDQERSSPRLGRRSDVHVTTEQAMTDEEYPSPSAGGGARVPTYAEATTREISKPGTSTKGPLDRLQSYLTFTREGKGKGKGRSSSRKRARVGADPVEHLAVRTADVEPGDRSEDVKSGEVTKIKGHSLHRESSPDFHPGLRADFDRKLQRPRQGFSEDRQHVMDAGTDERAVKFESVMSLESVGSVSEATFPPPKREELRQASGSRPPGKLSSRVFDTWKPQRTCWDKSDKEKDLKRKPVVLKSGTQVCEDASIVSVAKDFTDDGKRPASRDKSKMSPERDDDIGKVKPDGEEMETAESDDSHSPDDVNENANAYDAESDESGDPFLGGNTNTNALESDDSSLEEQGEGPEEKRDDGLTNTTTHAKTKSISSSKETRSDFTAKPRRKRRKRKVKKRPRRKPGSPWRHAADTNASSTDEYFLPGHPRAPRAQSGSDEFATSPHRKPRPGIRVRKFMGAGPICDYRLEPSLNIVQELQAKATAAASTISHLTTELTLQKILWRLARWLTLAVRAIANCCGKTTHAITDFVSRLIHCIFVGSPKRCRTTLTLFAITVVLLLSYYPFALVVFLTSVIPQRMDAFQRSYPWLHQCLLRTVYFSQGLNPFIFVLFSKKFRAALKIALSCYPRDTETIPAL